MTITYSNLLITRSGINCQMSSKFGYLVNFALELRGWSGGAKVLGKLPVPGRPTNLDYSRARAYCACNRCGWGVVWTFFLSSITSFLSPSLSGRRPDID